MLSAAADDASLLDAPERLEFERLLQWLRLTFLIAALLVVIAFGAPAIAYALAIVAAATASFVWVGLLVRYRPALLVRLQLGLRIVDCGLVYLVLVNYHGFLHDAYYDSVYVLFAVAAAATHGRRGSWLISSIAGVAVLISRLQLIGSGAVTFQVRHLTDSIYYFLFFVVTSTAVAFLMRKAAEVVRRRESAWSAELESRNAALAEAVQQREAMLAGVSHDLRTPLTVILVQVQLARRRAARLRGADVDQFTAGLAQIERAASRMARWIEGLLEGTRQAATGDAEELARQPTDLVAVAREIMADHQRDSQRHTVVLHTDAESIIGNWETAQIERVVDNLVGNAIKYSPRGGTVTVEVHASPDWAELVVSDQGVGIPSADLARIFEPFQRGANVVGRIGGLGLGLAGARRIVQRHGGTLDVDSAEGQGSTFRVRLPRSGD